jgi:hypothetical protein
VTSEVACTLGGPILCIGHSHLACVARAATTEGVSLRSFNFWDLPNAVNRSGEQASFSAVISDALATHGGAVFSMIGGAAHVVMGMLVHPRRFDFVLPEAPELPLDPQAELLPALAVRHVIESLTVEYLALMAEVRRLSHGSMYHMEPPPPSADGARMYLDVPWGMFPDRCAEISAAALRYKLWRVHSQVLQEWCSRSDVQLVAAPPASMDQSGFMPDAFYGDGAHANDHYGALVLRQMQERA